MRSTKLLEQKLIALKGKRIRELRLHLRITTLAMVRLIKTLHGGSEAYSEQNLMVYLSRYQQERHNAPEHHLIAIADTFGLPLSYFYEPDDKRAAAWLAESDRRKIKGLGL